MDWLLPTLTALGGVTITAVCGVIVALINNGGKRQAAENARYDQGQEDLKTEREAVASYRARVDLLEKIVVWYQRRDVAWYRREAIIITGAEAGTMPPWPEREGILTEEPK